MRYLDGIRSAFDSLSTHPFLGLAYEAAGPGARALVVMDHVIVYRVVTDGTVPITAGDIQISRVFGPGQDRPR